MDLATVALNRFRHSLEYTYKALSKLYGIPASTLCHCKNGRMLMKQRVINQQRLSPQEEKALVSYVLRMS